MMKRWIAVSMLVAVAVVVVSMVVAQAQESPAPAGKSSMEFACPMHADVKATWAAKCPKCDMTLTKTDAKPAAGATMMCPMCTMMPASTGKMEPMDMQAKMKKMGMSEPMMKH